MDITPFEIYLIMQMDSFKATFGLVAFGLTVLLAVTVFGCAVSTVEDHETKGFFRKAAVAIGATLTIIVASNAFFPSTKTMVTMYAIPETLSVLQSDASKRIGDKTLKGVEKLLDTYLADKTD